ncbi:hypothetical protein EGW08_014629 [Elysia chlorotica]|uniref:Uncharacterized protein n=1 Tax=Elysia chlorotica TaxID=188477 RepID=A0A433T7W1_ELYCH|nr:hypothetical protein EGW08_014629 [Elysia chlorotica]
MRVVFPSVPTAAPLLWSADISARDGRDGAPTTPTTPTNTYPTSAHLMTFMSPRRSPASSSGTSVMPRSSLSNSMNSETTNKRLWTESNTTPNTTNETVSASLSAKLSCDSPLYPVGFPEITTGATGACNTYRPNISFSDDSVTANASVGGAKRAAVSSSQRNVNYSQYGGSSPNIYPSPTPRSPDTLNPVPLPTATKSVLTTPAAFTSTRRPQKSDTDSSDTPYRLLAANLSRIPTDPEVSTRHGTFLEAASTSLVDATVSSRPSRSYANASRANINDSNQNNSFNSSAGIHGGMSRRNDRASNYSNNNRNSFHGDVRNNNTPSSSSSFIQPNSNIAAQSRLGGSLRADAGYYGGRPHSVSAQHRANLSTIEQSSASSSQGEPYSLSDMKAVLDAASTVDKPRDDDNTTTTSGSYTINADDLCQEIDQLFFKDIVV